LRLSYTIITIQRSIVLFTFIQIQISILTVLAILEIFHHQLLLIFVFHRLTDLVDIINGIVLHYLDHILHLHILNGRFRSTEVLVLDGKGQLYPEETE
jgi:hypothetical protein